MNQQQEETFETIDQEMDQQQLLLNMIYTLGFTSFIIGGIGYIVNKIWQKIIQALTCTIFIESKSDKELFQYVLDYIIKTKINIEKQSNVIAEKYQARGTKDLDSMIQEWFQLEKQQSKLQIDYKFNYGNYLFRHQGKFIYFNYRQEKRKEKEETHDMEPNKTIQISTLGVHNMHVLKDLLNQSIVQEKTDNKDLVVFQKAFWEAWVTQTKKKAKSLDDVILDTNIGEEVIQDIDFFINNKQWYIDRGVPYRRGYLFYGPPGTGKSSLIQAIAGKFQRKICTLSLAKKDVDDDLIAELVQHLPLDGILLIEDVDAVFQNRDKIQQNSNSRITFSGLLNALDGVRSQDGRILFMTTNHRELLDPAILRPGRADVHVKLDNASESQAKRLFLKFYPDQQEQAVKFSQSIPEYQISMAKLQGHFQKYKNSNQDALNNIKELVDNQNDFSQEMSIVDWLLRIGLQRHAWQFIKEDIKRIQDLNIIDSDSLEEFGIKTIGMQQRAKGVIEGNPEMMKQFRLMSSNNLRIFFKTMLTEYTPDIVQKLIEMVPENTVTEFQLRDIIDKQLQVEDDQLLNEIQKLVQRNVTFQKNPTLKSIYVQERHKKFKQTAYKPDPKGLLEKAGLKDVIPKIIEHQLDQFDEFIQIDGDIIGEQLEITQVVQSKKLTDLIESVKNKYEEEQKLNEEKELELAFDIEDFQQFITDINQQDNLI